MNAPEVISVASGELHGDASHQDGVMTVRIAGVADYAALDALEELLGAVHDECVRSKVKQTDVDLRQLEFMNSSCFKCLVSWITVLQEIAPAAQYKIAFISNPQMHWQKRSLHSLQCFAETLITVRLAGHAVNTP
jgi:hypothetical protein